MSRSLEMHAEVCGQPLQVERHRHRQKVAAENLVGWRLEAIAPGLLCHSHCLAHIQGPEAGKAALVLCNLIRHERYQVQHVLRVTKPRCLLTLNGSLTHMISYNRCVYHSRDAQQRVYYYHPSESTYLAFAALERCRHTSLVNRVGRILHHVSAKQKYQHQE